MGSVRSRLDRLEMRSSDAQPCRWCEQAYWTMVSTNPAIGPYCQTEYGNEVGLVTVRAYHELLREVGHEGSDDHLDHLPTYELEHHHEGVIEAWERVVESRPPREGCECFEGWTVLRSIDARVLYHYPRVAEALVDCLEQYAASPLDPRALYHFPIVREDCVCAPQRCWPLTPR